jgi:hydrogenase-4 component B
MILFAVGLGLVLLAGALGWALARRPSAADRVFMWGAIAGCGVALVPAISALTGLTDASAGADVAASATGGLAFGIDALSAWFLVVVLGAGAGIVAFGVPYLGSDSRQRRVRVAHLLLSVLLAALAGVVTARSIVAFLACWEVMALAAYFLVIFDYEKREVWGAGMVYLVLTHVSTLALIGMFAACAPGGVGSRFEDLRQAAAAGWVPTGLVLTLALIGFGIKAGAVPFHFWLPGAHAAAPSHVSALLSGIMLKVGIYGLLRMLALLGAPPVWWGWVVLFIGLASSVLGVLWALGQHDLKRLLAYHSVENIGIILLGVGLGALGVAYHQPAVAWLGVTGALLHALNHALFKSLLFLGAGSVARETGTREIDRLGGLARRMPRTALAFLIGSIAIVGLPPLNGFVSEWVIFRALLGTGSAGGSLRVAASMAVGLALTGGLALACFSKLYGVVFLGRERDASLERTGTADAALAAPQVFLAACCVAIAVAPWFVISAAARTARIVVPDVSAVPVGGAPLAGASWLTALSIVLLAVVLALMGARRLALRGRARRSSPTWSCAYPATTARMQYTASSYADPLLVGFGALSGVRKVRAAGSVHTEPMELVLDRLARPFWNGLLRAAARLRPLQSGGMRWYVVYAILCLLGLLLYLRFVALS